ncbi:MAG: MBL fold metallo-hydrolase [Pseudomonadota bacterium]
MLTGRPISLTVLDYGTFRVHSGPRIIGLMGALVQTDAGERVLIDTGMPAKYARDADAAGTEDGLHSFGEIVSMSAENLPDAQLAKAGVDGIDLLVISHTHIDHIGGLHGWPGVPMVISAVERALPKPLYWSGGQMMEWPDRETRLIHGGGTLGPGFEVFFTPGHAPGQLAFAIDLPATGRVIWTSDAISRPAEIDEAFDTAWEPQTALHHARRLCAMPHDLMIYGHCPEQWKTLRKAPEAYT